MTHQEMWAAYRAVNPDAGEKYEAWAYGDDPDTLAELTRTGVKTATASAGPLYGLDGDPLPEAGEYSVILNSRDEAVCVIRTTRVYTVPFDQVTAGHAYKEGEGGRTLEYWRRVHEKFFRAELEETGLAFSPEMPVVCEEFEAVFCPEEDGPMKMWKEKTWQHEITGVDGNTTLFGVNIFKYKWKSAGKQVKVRDPLYGQEYRMNVYTVTIHGQQYEFAAGEFSNCVWGFYLEKY